MGEKRKSRAALSEMIALGLWFSELLPSAFELGFLIGSLVQNVLLFYVLSMVGITRQ